MSHNSSKSVRELYTSLAGNPDNQYYLNLLEIVNSLLEETLKQLVKVTDKDEMLRLQGKALLLENFRANLTRKPVVAKQFTGSFN